MVVEHVPPHVALEGLGAEPLDLIEEHRVVDGHCLDVGTVSELINQCQNRVGISVRDAVDGTLTRQQAMPAKQPQPRLVRLIELGQLVGQPFECEQLLQLGWLWLRVALLPPGNRLRSGVEKLRNLARTDTGSILDGIEAHSDCTGHAIASIRPINRNINIPLNIGAGRGQEVGPSGSDSTAGVEVNLRVGMRYIEDFTALGLTVAHQ
jgi:hypothetical protein